MTREPELLKLNQNAWLSTNLLLKGLKDKGGAAPLLDQLSAELTVLQDEMQHARRSTRSIPGHVMFLEIYRRGSTKQMTMRWRRTNFQHTTWPAVQPLVQSMPKTMAEWYVDMNEHASLLNLKSTILVHNIRLFEQFQQPGGPERGTHRVGSTKHGVIQQQMLALGQDEDAESGEATLDGDEDEAMGHQHGNELSV
jgi:hypothetical protein